MSIRFVNFSLDLGDEASEENYGIPFVLVNSATPLVTISYGTEGANYSDESDLGPFPIPLNAPIEGELNGTDPTSGDRHLIAVDTENCVLYELYRKGF